MEAVVERPTLQDQRVARESLSLFTQAMVGGSAEGVRIQIQTGPPQGGHFSVTIPAKALQLLAFILANMAQGKAISLIPSDSEISTQQAADLLHVSRPHVVKLLEAGTIPFKKVGSHRRILVEDLLRYETQQKKLQRENLAFLVNQAQELSLGYE